MLAMDYRGPYRVRAGQKPEPIVEHPNDAIIQVTRSCICGSDLHLYHGLVPDTRVGTTFGHEFTGKVVEVGSSVRNLKVGDNVLVPFNVFCGIVLLLPARALRQLPQHEPRSDRRSAASTATRTRRAATTAARPSTCACPFADVGPTKIPDDIDATTTCC